MGKTLWEMLTAKAKGPAELQIENPLKLRLGNAVVIKEIDYKDLTFNVRAVSEYTREIGREKFKFTDYDLVAHPLDGEEVVLRLRLNPMDSPDKAAGLTHNVIILKKYDEMAHDEGFLNYLNGDLKTFQVNEDGVPTELYYRINDVMGAYSASVRIVDKENASNDRFTDIGRKSIKYWDFWRQVKDEGGTDCNEFLFVEMNEEDGWFELWRGQEIDPQDVTVL